MKEKEIHEKAIRLLEGGIVSVDGHNVKVGKLPWDVEPCLICQMDSICHMDTEMHYVCRECDMISQQNCYLILTHPG